MNDKRKKQMTYFTIALFFLFSGIEYAVILPTLWLYLNERFGAEPYFLGLVLSAFSFMGLFSSPIMGRWSDRTGKTKSLILFANLWEIGGNIMYWIGLNKWFILGSRLVAGVGSGVGASIIADIALATTPEERTGVLSIIMLFRQVGLLFGPAFNLFLRLCNFYIGPFAVDAYTVPGLFMALLWCLHELLVICLYFELKDLKEREQIRAHIKYSFSDTTIANLGANQTLTTLSTSRTASPAHSYSGDRTGEIRQSVSNSVPFSRTDIPVPISGSTPCSDFMYNDVSASDIQTINCQIGGENPEFEREIVRDGFDGSFSENDRPDSKLSRSVSKTNDMIESAERFMNIPISDSPVPTGSNGIVPQVHRAQERVAPPARSYGSIQQLPNSNDNYRDTEVIHASKWTRYSNEYLREEVVVILFAIFACLYNQTGLEAMVTPLTQRYLGWAELENSIMYFVAGVEIIIVFIIVRLASKCLTDCTQILGGFVVEVLAVCWLIFYMPEAPLKSSSNLAPFIIGVFLDCFGLPFVFTCSISLYSKVTSKETQGFSQGLRRSISGLATIFGPLWTGSLINNLYLCLGGMLGMMVLALVLISLSFKHTRRLELQSREDSETESSPVVQSQSEETRPLLT